MSYLVYELSGGLRTWTEIHRQRLTQRDLSERGVVVRLFAAFEDHDTAWEFVERIGACDGRAAREFVVGL